MIVLSTAAAQAATVPPSLSLVRSEPLTLAGNRFRPREAIRVVVDGRVVARATTSRKGTFTVVTPLRLDRCLDTAVSVVGAAGDRAQLEKLPKPACAPD